MKRARVIYNPTAGREQMKKSLPDVLQLLENAGFEASAHATTGENDATEAASMACEREYDLIIAAGGDGTLNEVIHGMANHEYRPKVGIIPMGTTNDFARALKIPKEPIEAMKIIIDGYSKKLDIGKANGHHFLNIAGGGKITEVTYDVPLKLKTVLGQLAYYIKGIELLPQIRPVQTRIEYDGKVFEGEIMMFLVANTNSIGGFEKLAPNAVIDDGYFDLLILKKTNIAEFVFLANKALRGNHIYDDHVIYTHAKKIKVTPESTMHLNLDGEYGGELPGTFDILENHIEFFVPNKNNDEK